MLPADTKVGKHPTLIMMNHGDKQYENEGNCIKLALKEMSALLRKAKSESYSICALLWSIVAVQFAK